MKKMKDSGIEWLGDIPENWNTLCHKRFMTKVKDICEKWDQEDVLSLTVNGVVKRDLDNPKGKMPATFDGYQFVYPGNLLLCLFDIDVTPRCAGKIDGYGVTSPAYSQYALSEGFDVGYYTYYFIALDDQKLLLHLTPTMRSSFNADEFAKIFAIAPPLSEQVEIAKHLDAQCQKIDLSIDAAERSIEEYKAYKQSVVFEAVTKGLNSNIPMKDSGIEWLGDIPENWDTICHKRFLTKVKNICEKWDQEDVISLTVNGVVKRDLDNPKGKMPATFDGYQFVYPGNLLLCLFDIDVTPRCAGKIDDYGVTSPAYSQYALGEGFDVGYYAYYFIALDDQKLLLHLTPTMRSSFNADEFAKISAIAPPLSEQVEIAKHLDKVCGEIDAAISAKQSIIEELKAYKKALIYEVVTGKREIDGC